MHQTRQETIVKLPIPRKGTKYVARARSHVLNSIPVVIAVRDMLKLARTSKEVNEMIKKKFLKINGKQVTDKNESVKLFNILEADKNYELTLSKNGKFMLVEKKDAGSRLCKVIGKRLVSGNRIQINMHDGTNSISKENIKVGDSVHIDSSGKVKSHTPLAKGKEVLIISGKYSGSKAKVESIEGKALELKISGKEVSTKLSEGQVVVI